MAKAGTDEQTMAETAGRRLMDDILSGFLEPGRKLSMEWLKSHYAFGSSPLREALARLSALGLVTVESHRGFRVAAASRADLADITFVRGVVETAALRRSMSLGDSEWEAGIVAAFARLEFAVSRRKTPNVGDPRAQIEEAHGQFHASLVASCDSPRLLHLQGLYYDQARRYRDLMVKRLRDFDGFVDEHRALMNLTIGRKLDEACRRLVAHFDLTPAAVYPDERPRSTRAGFKTGVPGH